MKRKRQVVALRKQVIQDLSSQLWRLRAVPYPAIYGRHLVSNSAPWLKCRQNSWARVISQASIMRRVLNQNWGAVGLLCCIWIFMILKTKKKIIGSTVFKWCNIFEKVIKIKILNIKPCIFHWTEILPLKKNENIGYCVILKPGGAEYSLSLCNYLG